MIGGFFDDSGTHGTSALVVLGGLLGTEAQWDVFHAEWSALLANPLPEKPALKKGFHLTDCRKREGEFADYKTPENEHVEYLFRQVILRAGLVSLAVSVDKLAWDELVTGFLREELGTSLECCFVRCIELAINTIRVRGPGEPIHLFFDEGIQDRLVGWAELYKSQAARYPEISGVSYAPVWKVTALQGADTIATATYQFGLQWLQNRENPKINPHFQDFMNRELSAGRIIAREHIEELVEHEKQSLGGLLSARLRRNHALERIVESLATFFGFHFVCHIDKALMALAIRELGFGLRALETFRHLALN